MGVFAEKRKAVAIRTGWLGWHPERRPMAFWLEVGRRVRAARIARTDEKRVKAVLARVEMEWSEKHGA